VRFARRAASITLAVYVGSSLLMHGVLREPPGVGGLSNLVGGLGALLALWLARAGRTHPAMVVLLSAILIDLLIDLLLVPGGLSPVLPFLPVLVVGVAILLDTRAVRVTVGVLLMALFVRGALPAADVSRVEPSLLLMTAFAIASAAALIPSVEGERRRHDREQASHTRQLETMLEHAPDAILLLDDRWRITHANRSARALLARVLPTADTVPVGEALSDCLDADDGVPLDGSTFRDEPNRVVRARLRGTTHAVVISAVRLQDAGTATVFEVVLRDLVSMLASAIASMESRWPRKSGPAFRPCRSSS
jgi:PAS domain-containing protein